MKTVFVWRGGKEEQGGRMFIRSYLVRADAYLSFLRPGQRVLEGREKERDILLPLCW